MKNLLITIPTGEGEKKRRILVRGDHTQSEQDMLQHALDQIDEFVDSEQPDEESIEHQFLLDSEAEERKGDVFLTLRMNRRSDHSYATHYYGEHWRSDNTPANGPVGYTDNKTVI